MAKLVELLKQTLLFAGGLPPTPTGLDPADLGPDSRDGLSDLLGEFPLRPSDALEDDTPLWRFRLTFPGDHPSAGFPNPETAFRTVEDLRCFMPALRNENVVFESIRWDDPSVRLPGGRVVTLPLTDRFRHATWVGRDGRIEAVDKDGAGPACTWRLPARLDVGFQHLFAYEIAPGGQPVKPVPVARLRELDFTPARGGPPGPRIIARPGRETTIRAGSVHVAVCTSLVCTRRADDFLPFRLAWVAHFYPLTMVVADRPLEVVSAAVTLVRPPARQLCHAISRRPVADDDRTEPPRPESEPMTPSITPGFYTDNNDLLETAPGPLPPALLRLYAPAGLLNLASRLHRLLPIWSWLFSYYHHPGESPRVAAASSADLSVLHRNEFTVIHAEGEMPERTVTGAVWKYDVRLAAHGPISSSVRKVKRQGAFDNLHLAPRMIAPANILAGSGAKEKSLRAIAMAPFCQHDCVHIHWRWGEEWGQIPRHDFLRGWANRLPHQAAGAPLVPENQRVRVRVPNERTAVYTAEAVRPEPGEWQIVFHHGGAYLLVLGKPLAGILAAEVADRLPVDPSPIGPSVSVRDDCEDRWAEEYTSLPSWAMIYWRLRYFLKKGKVYERLVYADDHAGKPGRVLLWS